MTTRRRFLTGCSVLTATVALKPSALLSASSVGHPAAVGLPGLSAFAGQVGTFFQVARSRGTAVSLHLEEARPLSTASPELGEHQFSLLFRGPSDQPLGQDTQSLRHVVLGHLTVFLVPVRLSLGAHQHYEAIFNRHTVPLV